MIDRGLERLRRDPEARARLVRWFWLISLAFTLFGFAVILYRVLA